MPWLGQRINKGWQAEKDWGVKTPAVLSATKSKASRCTVFTKQVKGSLEKTPTMTLEAAKFRNGHVPFVITKLTSRMKVKATVIRVEMSKIRDDWKWCVPCAMWMSRSCGVNTRGGSKGSAHSAL